MLDDLLGTRGAYILDKDLKILGKVPTTELKSTLKSLDSGVYAVVFEGGVDKDILQAAEKANVEFIIAKSSEISNPRNVEILVSDDL